jgi:hypothetical protein
MFQTVFSPSREEAMKLLEFGRYLWVEDVAEKVAAGKRLVIGGRLVSVNQEVSRYIEGNALKNYDLTGYHSTARMQPAPFCTHLVAHIPGLKIIHLEIQKRPLR